MVKYGVTGKARKRLVSKIEALTGQKAEYQGMPSMAYKVGDYLVTKDGTVEGNLSEDMIEKLAKAGFGGDYEEEPPAPEPVGIILNIPMRTLTEQAVENFENMVESKACMLKQVFGVPDLPIDYDEENLSVKWFENKELTPDETQTAMKLISAMLDKAGQQKRVSARPVETDNPKYNFRVFLNSIGLSGSEHKALRKALLASLPGSSAFRHGAPGRKEVTS